MCNARAAAPGFTLHQEAVSFETSPNEELGSVTEEPSHDNNDSEQGTGQIGGPCKLTQPFLVTSFSFPMELSLGLRIFAVEEQQPVFPSVVPGCARVHFKNSKLAIPKDSAESVLTVPCMLQLQPRR